MRTIYYCLRMLLRFTMIIIVTKYTTTILPFLIVVIFVVQLFYLRTSRQLRYLELETKAPLCAQFTEAASGLYHIRAFGWQHHNLNKSLQLLDDSQKPFYYLYAAERWLGLVMDSISLFVAVIITTITVWLEYITNASGVGLSMLSLISLSFDSMNFVREWIHLETSLGALSRNRDFVCTTPLEEDPEVPFRPHARWPQQGRVVMQDVVAKYDEDKAGPPVLDGISIDIPARAKVGIVGRTGSGKTSIAMTLLGFLDYTGKIAIDGIDISKIPKKKLRSIITAISQEDLDFDGTVRYNLFPESHDPELQKYPFNEHTAVELLRRLKLQDLIDQHNGLDTMMRDLGLSQGQKQLMSIARSCIRHYTYDTRIIIMDEATSSLDHKIQADVLQVFRELFYDCTVFAVAHRTETLKGYDIRIDMADGKLVSVSHISGKESAGDALGSSSTDLPAQQPGQPSGQMAKQQSAESESRRARGLELNGWVYRGLTSGLPEPQHWEIKRDSFSSDEFPEMPSRQPSRDVSSGIPLAPSSQPEVKLSNQSRDDLPTISRTRSSSHPVSDNLPRLTGAVPTNPFFEQALRLSEESFANMARREASRPQDRMSTRVFEQVRQIRAKAKQNAVAGRQAGARSEAQRAERQAQQAKPDDIMVEDEKSSGGVVDEKGKGRAE